MQSTDRFDTSPTLNDRLAQMAARGVRIARALALAFAAAVIGAIWIGAAVTDNAFAQIFVTLFAAIALWPPASVAALWLDSRIGRWRSARGARPDPTIIEATAVDASWSRLILAAPSERERVQAIQRSIAASHLALRDARLDPEAHDLCVLIDRRLPELIDRELDALPPDDRGRREGVASLIGLVEEFARHCGRKRDGRAELSAYEAEVLRRRFKERLEPPSLGPQ
jgi:hypothetical protein